MILIVFSHEEGLFGIYPRLGFGPGHLAMAVELDLLPAGSNTYDYRTYITSTPGAAYLGPESEDSFRRKERTGAENLFRDVRRGPRPVSVSQ